MVCYKLVCGFLGTVEVLIGRLLDFSICHGIILRELVLPLALAGVIASAALPTKVRVCVAPSIMVIFESIQAL